MTAPKSPKTITAAVIVIGNEVLSGRTKDTNSGWIAEHLTAHGVRLMETRVIPDVAEIIIATVNELRAKFDHIFTTGGIGPTHDDITAQCIADAFEVKLEQNAKAYDLLLTHYGKDELSDARLRMAMIPVGASLIPNPVSAAPGFIMGNVHVMAGVPKIMQAMMDHVLKTLEGGDIILSNTISCDIPESKMAEALAYIQGQYDDVDIGSYPYLRNGKLGVSVVLRGTQAALVKSATLEVIAAVSDIGGSPEPLELQVGI